MALRQSGNTVTKNVTHMIPLDLLASLRSAGFVLEARGEQLIVSPASKLTTEQRSDITANKQAMLAALRNEAVAAKSMAKMERAILAGWTPFPKRGKVQA